MSKCGNQKKSKKSYIYIYIYVYTEYGNIVTKKSFFNLYFSYFGEISHPKKTLMVDNVKVVAIIKCL
jgi:hypothetical protein